jgi:hypothetical protein
MKALMLRKIWIFSNANTPKMMAKVASNTILPKIWIMLPICRKIMVRKLLVIKMNSNHRTSTSNTIRKVEVLKSSIQILMATISGVTKMAHIQDLMAMIINRKVKLHQKIKITIVKMVPKLVPMGTRHKVKRVDKTPKIEATIGTKIRTFLIQVDSTKEDSPEIENTEMTPDPSTRDQIAIDKMMTTTKMILTTSEIKDMEEVGLIGVIQILILSGKFG